VTASLKLRNNRAAGASGLTVEDLKQWYTLARDPKDELGGPDEEAVDIWEKVLVLVHKVFKDGEIPTAFSNGTLVLIPKPGSEDFRGIALLDVVYKLVSQIMNLRIQSTITFDDAIHGFRQRESFGENTHTVLNCISIRSRLHSVVTVKNRSLLRYVAAL
jgi:hypothetical protein